jgi:hypothetical protein
MNVLSYLAGVFDTRGFIQYTYGTSYKYAVFFNFTENEKEVWYKIKTLIDNYTIAKIYKAKRKKGQKEYMLYISGKKNVMNFLIKILPYSNRKDEISMYVKFLKERGRKIKLD